MKLFSSRYAPVRSAPTEMPADGIPEEDSVPDTELQTDPKPAAHDSEPQRIPEYVPGDELPEAGMPDIGGVTQPELELSDIDYGDLEPLFGDSDLGIPEDTAAQPPEEPEKEPEEPEEPEPAAAPPAPAPAQVKRHTAPKKARRGFYLRRRTGKLILLVLIIALAAAAAAVAIIRLNAARPGSPLADGYVFSPKAAASSKAGQFITSTAVMVNDGEVESYTAPANLTINFGAGEEYSQTKGVICFRGNNFRSSASYGTVQLTAKKFTENWSAADGTLTDASGTVWSGSGWTGQPLIVCGPDSVRQKMSCMYDWAREKTGLVEVIYPTMDGNIYFTELSTGKATRAPMNLGFTFKGTGTLDPRGYPILYVGSGTNSTAGKSRVFIINLMDCTVLYRFGYYESFAKRSWNMWDASPLVDSATDQLIYPGENGLLYIVHLNTLYDAATGTVTVNPDNVVKWRYQGVRTTAYTYWTGFEASPVCWQGRIIMADNGGNLICLNLNTLKTDWVCDVLDDTSCSPVLSLEKDGVYVYIGAAFHPGWRSNDSAAVPVWKINAVTGEAVWETDYTCAADGELGSGVQGTLAVGKKSLEGMLFVPVASTPDAKSGTLAALDRATGKELWRFDTKAYSWSSPVDVYDADGNGYIVYTTSEGKMYLLDGKTGAQLDVFDLGGTVEASPAVYGNWAAIGTEAGKIWGVKLG